MVCPAFSRGHPFFLLTGFSTYNNCCDVHPDQTNFACDGIAILPVVDSASTYWLCHPIKSSTSVVGCCRLGVSWCCALRNTVCLQHQEGFDIQNFCSVFDPQSKLLAVIFGSSLIHPHDRQKSGEQSRAMLGSGDYYQSAIGRSTARSEARHLCPATQPHAASQASEHQGGPTFMACGPQNLLV